MVRDEEGSDHIRNWMRNRNTVEFLGLWKILHNPDFKPVDLDGFTEYSKIISLLNDDFSFSIFPNPANQYLQISSDQKLKQIEILDNTGKSVFVTNKEDKELHISFLESGVHYLKIDRQKLKRFVKL